jgi:hypothetical protein
MPYRLEDEDYLKLWMYFQDRADAVKEAMFKTLTWIVGFAAALLGFIFVALTNYDASKAKVPLSWLVFTAAGAGIVVCVYSGFVLSESGKHIRGNWRRADRCLRHVPDLVAIVGSEPRTAEKDSDDGGKLLEIWQQLGIIVALFAAAFVAILAWTFA